MSLFIVRKEQKKKKWKSGSKFRDTSRTYYYYFHPDLDITEAKKKQKMWKMKERKTTNVQNTKHQCFGKQKIKRTHVIKKISNKGNAKYKNKKNDTFW